MCDRREEILLSVFNKYKEANPADNWASWDDIKKDGTARITFDAMDEYMKECCIDLLEYVVFNTTDTLVDVSGVKFRYKGEWISKEQLFENFL